MKLTREQFQTLYEQGPDAVWAVIAALQATVEAQQQQSKALSARVKVLEDQLNTDSHNSSKPPSSDGFKKPVSLRQPTGRKPGGQKGHPGRHLAFSDQPDQIVVHTPLACACCGAQLAEMEGVDVEARQVVDLPPLSLVITEHRRQKKVCPHCGHPTQVDFPAEARASVQYGPRLKAFSLYLKDYQLLPYARIAGMFADLFDASFCPGTLFTCEQDAAWQLGGVLACIRDGLVQSEVSHFDETGLRLRGRLHWLHVASTPTLSYYDWHTKRGTAGMAQAGILPHFAGIAVHDGWSSYRHYACSHALCNAHHLRELTALYEQDGQDWARRMRSLLYQLR